MCQIRLPILKGNNTRYIGLLRVHPKLELEEEEEAPVEEDIGDPTLGKIGNHNIYNKKPSLAQSLFLLGLFA